MLLRQRLMASFDEAAPDEKWGLKKTDEDGVFVKLNDCRFITNTGLLTEQILKVEVHKKARAKDDSYVLVSKSFVMKGLRQTDVCKTNRILFLLFRLVLKFLLL